MMVPVVALATAGVAAAANGGFTPQHAHSPNAHRINTVYYVIFGFTAAIFVIVETALVVFILKYRSRGRGREVEGAQVHGNTRLELIWTALPAVILFIIGIVVFIELPKIANVPGGERERPAEHHRRGPSVLLAVRLPERRAIDRRSARACEQGRLSHDRLTRRRAQLVDPAARRQDRRDPRQDEPHVVQGGPRRHLQRASARSSAASSTRRCMRRVIATSDAEYAGLGRRRGQDRARTRGVPGCLRDVPRNEGPGRLRAGDRRRTRSSCSRPASTRSSATAAATCRRSGATWTAAQMHALLVYLKTHVYKGGRRRVAARAEPVYPVAWKQRPDRELAHDRRPQADRDPLHHARRSCSSRPAACSRCSCARSSRRRTSIS